MGSSTYLTETWLSDTKREMGALWRVEWLSKQKQSTEKWNQYVELQRPQSTMELFVALGVNNAINLELGNLTFLFFSKDTW